MRAHDILAALKDPDAAPLSAHDEGSTLILRWLVHMYFSDGHIDHGEVVQLKRLLGEADAGAFVTAQLALPLDPQALAARFPSADERRDILEILERAMWDDDEASLSELDLFDQLVAAFELDD